MNPDVFAAFLQLLRVDYRSFVHQNLQIWDPRRGSDSSGFDPDELVDRWIERVPQESIEAILERLEPDLDAVGDLEPALRTLDVPLFFAQHEGCVAFMSEGFEDAAAAFPDARTLRVPVGPNMSREFADELEVFCREAVRLPG